MTNWLVRHRPSLERDILHDFCLASDRLCEQRRRFAENGTISFPVMKTLVGDPMSKGLLWRLKDTAHLLFRRQEIHSMAGALLDWTLGYVFHESLKLMEDAHQQQYYAPQLAGYLERGYSPAVEGLVRELADIRSETSESMEREILRLDNLLTQARKLFILYFSGRAGHRPLARFLLDREELARKAFGQDYDLLLRAVYGEKPARMYLEAAGSFKDSGRNAEAAAALETALALEPALEQALAFSSGGETAREPAGRQVFSFSPAAPGGPFPSPLQPWPYTEDAAE